MPAMDLLLSIPGSQKTRKMFLKTDSSTVTLQEAGPIVIKPDMAMLLYMYLLTATRL